MKKIMFLMALISVISNAEITVNSSQDTRNISKRINSIDDMTVNGDGAYKNGGDPKDMDYTKFLNGYSVDGDGFVSIDDDVLIFENNHVIDLNGEYNSGIMVKNNGSAGNSGIINIYGKGGIGLFTGDGTGTLVNRQTGIINVSNSGIGIASAGWPYNNFIGSIRNDGTITIDGAGTGIRISGAIDRDGGTAENNGKIELNGGGDSIGVYVGEYNTFINNGEISGTTIGTEKTTLISAVNQGQIINSADGILRGMNNAVGIEVSNAYNSNKSKVINDGYILTENGDGIFVIGADVVNNGIISSGTVGIRSTKYSGEVPASIVLNNGIIQVQENGTGIYGVASTVENNGIIEINGNNTTGIRIRGYLDEANATLINNADITADQNKQNVILLKAVGSGVTGEGNADLYNNANLTAEGEDSVAIYSQNAANVHNRGNITVNNGTGIMLQNSSLNEGDNIGTITVRGFGTGISADSVNSNIVNNGTINLEGNGTGIYITSGNIGENKNSINLNGAGGTGVHIYRAGTAFVNFGSVVSSGGPDNTGIRSEEGNLQNLGDITIYNGTGIESTGSYTINAGTINNKGPESKGISSYSSRIDNTGRIAGDGTGIDMKDNSILLNDGVIEAFGTGTGVISTGSFILNSKGGIISSEYNSGISAFDSSVENYGIIKSMDSSGIISNFSSVINKELINSVNGTGIESSNSYVLNEGTVISGNKGIYADNNTGTINTGVINSAAGVEITAGSNEYSGHFLNTGEINGLDYAIKFNNGDNVLELNNGSKISGKIQGSEGDNTVIVSGNVELDELTDFSKLVVMGDTALNGNIYLKPTNNENYYTAAFSSPKDFTDISNEASLGNLVLTGTINVGVDYDGITDETSKTGKIIADSINVQNGDLVLSNGGKTAKSITEESGLTNTGDQIRVKSIVISSKQQAVDPEFQFSTSEDMKAGEDWISETVSRIENGVTVLDELYTNVKVPVPPVEPDLNPIDENTDTDSSGGGSPAEPAEDNGKAIPSDNENTSGDSEIVVDPIYPAEKNTNSDDSKKPAAAVKINYVPRNRADLDNMNKITSISEKILDTEVDFMKPRETITSLEYIGTKGNTDFNQNSMHNYNYDTDADGISGSIVHKLNDNISAGITIGYIDNDVRYSNNDTEEINSANINIFGKYQAGNFSFDAHAGYGHNGHKQKIDWLGAGIQEGRYDSNVVKTGISFGYNQKLYNDSIILRPDFGVEYTSVYEGTIKTENMSDISSVKGDGLSGKIGLNLMNTTGKLRWNAGIGYERSFTDTYHKERNMVNNYKMAKLDYGQDNWSANIDLNYGLTDKIIIKSGYEYENNENYENHNFKAGISYILDK